MFIYMYLTDIYAQNNNTYRKQNVSLVLIYCPWVIHWLRELDDRNTLS